MNFVDKNNESQKVIDEKIMKDLNIILLYVHILRVLKNMINFI